MNSRPFDRSQRDRSRLDSQRRGRFVDVVDVNIEVIRQLIGLRVASRHADRNRVSAGFEIERITSFNSLLFPLMVWSRMRQKRDQNLQRWRELEINPPLNKTLESILKIERLLIEKGVSFPVGGSLLLIGRRPLSPS